MELPRSGKLVRDRIPDLIRAAGERPRVVHLDAEQLAPALEMKLLEEADEFIAAGADEKGEELADLLEVVRALAEAHSINWHDVEQIAHQKRSTNGGFDERSWLIDVD